MGKVTIVVPTYNEADNIPRLVKGIREAVRDAEILVMDDNSPDGTSRVASDLGCTVITRTEDRGLAHSVICGLSNICSGTTVVVMDADLSHDPGSIPQMLRAVDSGYDLVIGSRFVPGGSTPDWSRRRRQLSRVGTCAMRLFTGVHDMNSGFMAFPRNIIDIGEMRPTSWKVLFELFFKGNWKQVTEVPITFHDRCAGSSKFNLQEMLRGMLHFTHLLIHPGRRRRGAH